ncbi:acyl-CoA dehydrogenase family protein [Piscinibacter koreensis]|uniref:Acyl-CoA dehydrogenase family protein n=1 Tax=Piscinibacter koreensis TaxID=2742824 RepID=A0A7Y6NPY5_9BURK|nr:acyl-CoA dehydrogenase family protein [Schlegelella koreensis]NUZ07186.1 acyl-CoA dehydrogenase family protein [Schlegelella koreensis]
MDFDFSDDQEMLRDSVRRWVERGYTFERRRGIVQGGGFARDAWQEIADLGLLGLQVPEQHGGMGFGPVDAMVVMQELGRALVLEPYAPVALVATSLLAAGDAGTAASWLEGVASGEKIVVLAHQERRARHRLEQIETRAERAGDGWRLTGTKIVVPAAGHAAAFIVPARVADAPEGAGGIGLFLVTAGDGVRVDAYVTQDGAASGDLRLDGASGTELLAPGAAFPALERAVDVGIAALAAEAVGAMDRLVEVTVEYMNTRKQFGVTIATFQALRHRIADVKMQLELARSMSYFATLKLDDPEPQRRRALSQAKVQLGQSMRFVGQQCIQLHGGIGVTDEYIAGHYFKRLTVMEMTFGDTLHHLGEVSARMEDTAGVFA